MSLLIKEAKEIVFARLGRKNLSKRTLEYFSYSFDFFEKFLILQGITDLKQITEKDINVYLDYLSSYISKRFKKNLSYSSIMHHKSCARVLFETLVLEGYLFEDPFRLVKTMKSSSTLPGNILSEKEISDFFSLPDTNTYLGFRNRTMF